MLDGKKIVKNLEIREELLRQYGGCFDFDGSLKVQICELFEAHWFDELGIETGNWGKNRYSLEAYVELWGVSMVKGQMSIYANAADFGRGRRTTGKIGKMLRRMFPDAKDVTIDRAVDAIKESWVFDTNMYTIHVSDEASEFAHAYSHTRAPDANLCTTTYRKSLSCSCMRNEFENLSNHPAEAYASGDFWIVYATDPDGFIAGRCVVRKDPCISGPIYGVNEIAVDVIEEHIKVKLNGRVWCGEYGVWLGARLERIEYYSDGFIAPYLDIEPKSLTDNGDYLVVCDYGEIDATDYEGVLESVPRSCCYRCGDPTYPDYLEYVHDEGDWCPSCVSCFAFTCSDDGALYPGCYRVDVNYIGMMGLVRTRTYHASSDAFVEATDGQLWVIEDTVEDVHGDRVPQPEIDNGKWIYVSTIGELYPADECATLDGEIVPEVEIDPGRHTYNNETGEWETRDAA